MTFNVARVLPLALTISVGACVPTAARKNARLEAGFDGDITVGVQYIAEGEAQAGRSAAPAKLFYVEGDFQWAGKFDGGSGIALQLKVPMTIVFTTLDLYYQLPETTGNWYFGFGAELGALPGLYGVVTHYFDDELYLTFTPRVLNAKSRNEQAVLINPQLALGKAGSVDASLFLSFAHHTGAGYNFDIDFCPDDRNDYRKNFVLAGGSLRF